MATDPLIGTTIGGCMILEVIGQGGMGVIYKARQKSLDRVVALKVLAPHLANDANFVGRFQREARAIARVNHPNILAVYDVGDDQNTNYMIMELIDGQSLAEMQTERRGALPWEEAATFIKQAAQGLEAAQASGIIHRDIKPENLMVTKKGVIKVSDFGLAKDADATTTSTDAVMGTPAFMSPEQCDGKKVDGRSDIYSLGGTFYRLITGRLPFEAETAMSMMYRHKHEALIPPHEVVPTLSQVVSEIIIKMMAKKREGRYQTMTEVIDAIDQARQAPASHPPQQRMQAQAAGDDGGMAMGHSVPPSSYDPPDFPAPPTGLLNQDDSHASGRRAMPAMPVGLSQPGASNRMNAASSRMPATSAPPGGFGSNDSSSRMSMPSGLIGGMAPGLAVPDDAYTAVASGDEALARGDRTNAMKAYRKALGSRALDNATRARIEAEVRKEMTSRRQAADNLLKRGLLVEASREFRILMEIDPSDEGIKALQKDLDNKLAQKRTLVNDIRTAIAGNQFERAIKVWDSTPTELRDDALSKQIEQLRSVVVPSFKLAEQGESFAKQGRLEEAIATFEDALKINAACEVARIGLKDAEQKVQRIEFMLKEGYQYSLEQNYAKAVETWKPILTLRPGHPQTVKSMLDAYVAHAQYLRAQGDLEGALAAYKGAAETDPQNRSVRKVTEDLTNLFDKESALVDRANDSAARGNLSAAIKYWKDVQRLNPANKRAGQQVNQLVRMRSGGRAKFMVVGFLLILGVAAGYQYWTEMRLLKDCDQAMSDKKYEDVASLLNGTRTFFMTAKLEALKSEANEALNNMIAETKIKQNPSSPENRRNFADILRRIKIAKEKVRMMAVYMSAAIQGANESVDIALVDAMNGNDLNAESKLAAANNYLAELQAETQNPQADPVWPNPLPQQFSEEMEKVNTELVVINAIKTGMINKRNGSKQEAIRQFRIAQTHVAVLARVAGLDQFISKQMNALGADNKLGSEALANARAALAIIDAEGEHKGKDDARKFLIEAQKQGTSNREEVEQLLQYVDDLVTCEKESNNMRLYQPTNPVTNKSTSPWTGNNRVLAFCIDRFEYPNQAGKQPETEILYLDAVKKCTDVGKQLCSISDWNTACKGGANFTQPYPYGVNPIPNNCNTEGKAPVASGSNKPCKNSIGVYDMSGNVAEFVNNINLNPNDNLVDVVGGSYGSSANRSSCDDKENPQRLKSEKYKDVGFRCCLKLVNTDK